MKTAYIMIGIQGSGKSEFCRRYLPGSTRVNLDTLKTRNNEARMIEACHSHGIDYVVDNTNPTREDRARYIPAAKAEGYRVIGYFMQSRLQDCIARNNRREGKEVVPPKAIAMTSALSSKVADGDFIVVDKIETAEYKTKTMVKMLSALEAKKKVLVVLAEKDEKVQGSFANIPGVKVALTNTINVYDILNCDSFIVAKAAAEKIEEVYA